MKSFSYEARIGKISTVIAKRRGVKMRFKNIVIMRDCYFLRQD